MRLTIEQRYISFFAHYSKDEKTIDEIKHNLKKKRAKRSSIKSKQIVKKIKARYFTEYIKCYKIEPYYTEEEMLTGYLAPSYEELSESEKKIYNEKQD